MTFLYLLLPLIVLFAIGNFLDHRRDRNRWRVHYPDGRQTRLLPYDEAECLQGMLGGTLRKEER